MSSFAANAVWLLHALILGAALTVPFCNDDHMLAAYVFIVPFIWVHWIMNNDTCALTALECRLRGLKSDGESFIYKVVSPMYKIRNADAKRVAQVVSVALWCLVVYRVRQRGSLSIAWRHLTGKDGDDDA